MFSNDLFKFAWKTCSSAFGSPQALCLAGFLVITTVLCWIAAPTKSLPVDITSIPERRKDDWPLLGNLRFWSARWDFFDDYRADGKRNFSFRVGPYPVIGLTGENARKVFFEDRRLSFNEGYAMLFGQTPGLKPKSEESIMFENSEDEKLSTPAGFGRYFQSRFIKMMHPENFLQGLPGLLSDTKDAIQQMSSNTKKTIDPFSSIYEAVFRMTVRTVGCKDIADDKSKTLRMLACFESIASSSTPASVILPWWVLTPGKMLRLWGGFQLFSTISDIAKKRRRTGVREEDPLQYLLDQNDSPQAISRFILSAVYSGYANTGINAAYLLCYLATHRYWLSKARTEAEEVVRKYSKGSKSLADGLSDIPISAWTTEFPVIELCIRETIRMTVMGAAFRWNGTTSPVYVDSASKTAIPPGFYATYHVGDVHRNASIYAEPESWDPERFLEGRKEHEKVPLAFLGWGAGRHVCLGMHFAKLEQTILIAFFIVNFDFRLIDRGGVTLDTVPPPNRNTIVATKPAESLRLKITKRI